ncbi:hypothetical protein W97_05079 [Coniosporium apollinis CBS 100218]|uniref:Uncharacterized protein n=1 Tax=Coniosporium apollinis (strain CBS 100218) TaxID=1168221 RepID=R7YVA3_CONA1|nr:uncharacterized protein W97_05079 [Coniosporium apollinis CBS 100218]EON65837.1 hypothetical protein W97_05079 [Coniosporium apollinis CBS 100218]
MASAHRGFEQAVSQANAETLNELSRHCQSLQNDNEELRTVPEQSQKVPPRDPPSPKKSWCRRGSSVYSGEKPKNWPIVFILAVFLLVVWEEMQFDCHYRIPDPPRSSAWSRTTTLQQLGMRHKRSNVT